MVVLAEEEEEDEGVSGADEDEVSGVPEMATAVPAKMEEARNAASVGHLINVYKDYLPANHSSGIDWLWLSGRMINV